MDFSSKLLENAVNEVSQLPGIGKRTALRLVLHLLKQPEDQTLRLSQSLQQMREEINFCKSCHNISDTALCEICANPNRDGTLVCVVEDIRDVMAIENTSQYKGHYHVLGGKISPMDGIGPEQIKIKELVQRIQRVHTQGETLTEIIFALDPSVEGEATTLYLTKLLRPMEIKMSRIAFGLPMGGNLEYADEITLARALEGRREI